MRPEDVDKWSSQILKSLAGVILVLLVSSDIDCYKMDILLGFLSYTVCSSVNKKVMLKFHLESL